MMSLTRHFEIQNGVDFSSSHLKTWAIQKQGIMVKPCISVVVSVEGFALCKDGLHPFHSYHVVFEVVV